MARSDFYTSLGAPPSTKFSWSAVNHNDRKVYFGAWTNEQKSADGGRRIFSSDWQKIRTKDGRLRNNPNYKNSLNHISLVQTGGYLLFTFPQCPKYSKDGKISVASYSQDITRCYLVFEGNDCFAVPIKDSDSKENCAENTDIHWEGHIFQILQTGYERNTEARQQCLETHGYKCAVCEFDFEIIYGEIGHAFIHVHHLVRMKDRPKPYLINGANELRPVCPNCHAMLHKKVPPYTVEDMKEIIRAAKNGLKVP